MNLLSSSLMLPVILVIFLAKKASAILCYDCNSEYDPRCGENFDPFSLGVVNCSMKEPPDHVEVEEASICRTIKMDIKGKIRVVRQCGYITEHTEKPCRRQTSTGDLFVTYCACDTDLCNAASHNKILTALVLTAMTVMAVLLV